MAKERSLEHPAFHEALRALKARETSVFTLLDRTEMHLYIIISEAENFLPLPFGETYINSKDHLR